MEQTPSQPSGATLTLSVNGEALGTDALPTTPLLEVLRSRLGLAGVRAGCSIGSCGACTVLISDGSVRSCDLPISEVGDRPIVTPEGIGRLEAPGPVQSAFLDAQAAQCGYCINGIIMTVESLRRAGIRRGSEVHEALRDHLCRCGAHVRIVAAAERALGIESCDLGEECCADRSGDSSEERYDIAPDGTEDDLPPHVAKHPYVAQWLVLDERGVLTVLAGKVEIGQGILTALAQIAAAQLDLPLASIVVKPTEAPGSPDQRLTAGSLSVEEAGSAVARAGAALRRLVLARAAVLSGLPPQQLRIGPCGVASVDGAVCVDFNQLLEDGPIDGPILVTDEPRWSRPVGEPVPRLDLPRKLSGSPAYVQDDLPSDVAFARAVLPPTPDARLTGRHVGRAESIPQVLGVLVEGRIVIVLAESDWACRRACDVLRQDLEWEIPPRDGSPRGGLEDLLRSLPTERMVVRADEAGSDVGLQLTASYLTPFQSHGSVAPAAAVARLANGVLHVRSATQGPYPLRRELAALLDLPLEAVVVEHVDGPGCYGMNGADDAAALAAFSAVRNPGRSIRFQFSVNDEFNWAPKGSAMLVDLAAGLAPDGQIERWVHRGISDVHKARPNGSGEMLLPSWLRDEGAGERPWPGPEEGGARNAVPLYRIPSLSAHVDFVRGPVRASSLRCLGAFGNLFAIESFMDELAEAARQDPVQFRLANLSDARARLVLETVAERSGYRSHVGPSGQGRGVAVARYKGKAYVAVAAQVDVDPEHGRIEVRRLIIACDAGRIVNPDGLRNQLEGGALQGLSRALFEDAGFLPHLGTSLDWTNYPVIGFADVPVLAIHLVDRPELPSLGVGEAATPVVAPAVANAIDDAIGVRLRSLPMDAASIERRLLAMDATESARVRLA